MPVLTKTFDELLTYSRDSGATRVNSVGRIVGVDFSTTSVTFGTGAKTFTLAADANVNRDWPVGSKVRATSQAAPLGLMNGTVTSYNPATQELVIDVTTSTGTGSGTNWRIGSLEFRRDFDPVTLAPKGGLVEGGATNRYSFSNDISNAAWIKEGATAINPVVSPDGSANAFTLVESTGTGGHQFRRNGLGMVAGQIHHLVFFVQPAGRSRLRLNTNAWTAASENIDFNFNTDTFAAASRFTVRITSFGSFKRVFISSVCDVSGDRANGNVFQLGNDAGLFSYTGDGVSGMRFYGINIRTGSADTSGIPTTTTSVTRAADLLAVTGSNYSEAANPSLSSVLLEFIPTNSTDIQTVASLNDGTVNNDIDILHEADEDAALSVTVSGVEQANVVGGVLTLGAVNKIAYRAAANNFGVSVNGAETVVDNTGTVPLTDRLSIGTTGALTLPFNGHIRKLRYFPSALTNEQLEELSA